MNLSITSFPFNTILLLVHPSIIIVVVIVVIITTNPTLLSFNLIHILRSVLEWLYEWLLPHIHVRVWECSRFQQDRLFQERSIKERC